MLVVILEIYQLILPTCARLLCQIVTALTNIAWLTASAAAKDVRTPIRAILASFHQGNDKFGETRGIQCSCISLFGIAFTVF